MDSRIQITAVSVLDIKTLNNVAVEYYKLGLRDLSYQIWDKLYDEIQCGRDDYEELLPAVCCNMGNMLRQTGYYEEAYCICSHGLKHCFKTGILYAVPELLLQLSLLCVYPASIDRADPLYAFGIKVFQWSRQSPDSLSDKTLMKRDFLLCF